MSDLVSNVLLLNLGRPGGVAGLRWDAVHQQDCPHCKVEAGVYCKSESGVWSAVPHDGRIDLALKEYVDNRSRWWHRIGFNRALTQAREAVGAIEEMKP